MSDQWVRIFIRQARGHIEDARKHAEDIPVGLNATAANAYEAIKSLMHACDSLADAVEKLDEP